MSSVYSLVLPGMYRDSIFLMQLSRELTLSSGARQVYAIMATARNKELLARSNLLTLEIEAALPDDLAIAIDATGESLAKALVIAREVINRPEPTAYNHSQLSIEQAVRMRPVKSLTMLSVPGEYARYEAARALENNADVFFYSGDVSIEDELALKKLASSKGVLLMGPECGSAAIDGVPLGFVNRVRRGEIGIVASTGTGLQEVSCLLDRCGLGISSAYGTGGRDMTDAIGGLSTLTALQRLADDPVTKLVLVIGTLPGEETRKTLLQAYRQIGKPVLARYFGVQDCRMEQEAGIRCAKNLTDLASLAASQLAPVLDISEIERPDVLPSLSGVAPRRGFVRGIFSGGALCRDAVEQVQSLLPDSSAILSNTDIPGVRRIMGTSSSTGHTFLDMGANEFTIGRPHPIVSPEIKLERIVTELCAPDTAVVLADIILGYGVAKNQLSLFVQAIDKAAALSSGKSRAVPIVVSVCGTENDDPSRSSQIALLQEAGIAVLGSNARAAAHAVALAGGL